ncbi:mannitol dehydrogenase family protein [Rathayibacter sp. VKM Ac-2835]|nr:mannitol dehydrogenase family protein [Rathayibacter sp. VKM Ac-2835]
MSTDAPRRLSRTDVDRPTAPIRIVHLGLGAFHRAHQAWFTDVVDRDHEWGIAAFTGRTPTAADELAPQDGLFTVIERSADSDTARIVGSIVEATPGTDIDRLVTLIAAPTTAIITTTITEAGYRLLPDGSPDLHDDDLRTDIAALRGDGRTSTALGRILLGLQERRSSHAGPIAVVPCDNIPDNGAWLRRGMLALAADIDPDLTQWIEDNVSFVSTSVDRITPKTTHADLAVAGDLTGFADAAAVVTEPFRDWVLSGSFPAGRPAWEEAGARFVEDIEPFERRKLWLLNGAHTLLAYSARLLGHETVSAAIADPTARAWVNEFWDEAVRHLPAGLDLDSYRAALLDRFDNARIVHRLDQIGQDGVTKLRVRIVPTLLAERAAGRDGAASIRPISAWLTTRLTGLELPDSAASAIEGALHAPDPTIALLSLIDPRLTADPALLDDIRTAAADASVPDSPTEKDLS